MAWFLIWPEGNPIFIKSMWSFGQNISKWVLPKIYGGPWSFHTVYPPLIELSFPYLRFTFPIWKSENWNLNPDSENWNPEFRIRKYFCEIWKWFFEIWRHNVLPGVVENVTLPPPLSHLFSSRSRKWNSGRGNLEKSFVYKILIHNFAPSLLNRFCLHQDSRTGQESQCHSEAWLLISRHQYFCSDLFLEFLFALTSSKR